MRELFAIILFFLFNIHVSISGQCYPGSLGILPATPFIAQGNIFIMTFDDRYYGIRKNFEHYNFFVINGKANKSKLEIIDTLFYEKYTQILLKPVNRLKIGDSISLRADVKQEFLDDKSREFCQNLSFRKWVVKQKREKIKPEWGEGNISYVTEEYLNSSAPGHSVTIKLPVADNSFKRLRYEDSWRTIEPVYYRVEVDTFICYYPSTNGGIYDWSGFCEFDIPLNSSTTYNARIQIMDISGNVNDETKTVSFRTAEYKGDELFGR